MFKNLKYLLTLGDRKDQTFQWPDVSYSPLWEEYVRTHVKATKLSEQEINARRAENLIPGKNVIGIRGSMAQAIMMSSLFILLLLVLFFHYHYSIDSSSAVKSFNWLVQYMPSLQTSKVWSSSII